jgi:FtsH-binding integral membrane protein
MRNSQGTTLLFLAIALVLFFFSLSLLPAVELYCRFIRPAIVLLVLEFLLLVFLSRVRHESSSRVLIIATFVFAILGIGFNAVLLIAAKGKC